MYKLLVILFNNNDNNNNNNNNNNNDNNNNSNNNNNNNSQKFLRKSAGEHGFFSFLHGLFLLVFVPWMKGYIPSML